MDADRRRLTRHERYRLKMLAIRRIKSWCFQPFGAIALRTLRYIGSYVMPALRSADEHRPTGCPY